MIWEQMHLPEFPISKYGYKTLSSLTFDMFWACSRCVWTVNLLMCTLNLWNCASRMYQVMIIRRESCCPLEYVCSCDTCVRRANRKLCARRCGGKGVVLMACLTAAHACTTSVDIAYFYRSLRQPISWRDSNTAEAYEADKTIFPLSSRRPGRSRLNNDGSNETGGGKRDHFSHSTPTNSPEAKHRSSQNTSQKASVCPRSQIW